MSNKLIACIAFALTFAACSESRRDPPDINPGPKPPTGGNVCGNGALNGFEPCDGTAFRGSRECMAAGLGMGNISCSSSCQLDLSTCSFRDYCTANNLYTNGECDNCELLGGVPDPECTMVCGANGTCGDKLDPLTGQWTCKRRGMTDPDCGMCGNQIIEGNELCDGMTQKPGSNTCADWGFEDGTLGCTNCLPTFADCRAASCGDGNVEGPEQCEGTNLQGASCENSGFAGGMLTCTSTCGVSYAACVAPGCGNNIIEGGRGEECEGQNLGGQSCEMQGFAAGTLACDASCHFDARNCVSPGCGNMIIEAPQEECEGTNLNNGTCQTQGFVGGTLSCSSSSCTYDTSMCVAPGCGNNIIEAPTEQCEGSNLNNSNCQTVGFLQGTLSCDANCRFDTSMCIAPGCGNNIIEAPNEQCESGNLNGATCQTQGFLEGTLQCNSSCRYDTAQCFGMECGNGIARGLEPCDGTDFTATNDCNAYGLGFANMSCTPDCKLDFNDCGAAVDLCSMNGWYNDGVCDACRYYDGTLDPDCTNACGANGTCASYYEGAARSYTCLVEMGMNDPDCGCGNGALTPDSNGLIIEVCDGTMFHSGAGACTDWNYVGGTLRCGANCLPEFTQCTQ